VNDSAPRRRANLVVLVPLGVDTAEISARLLESLPLDGRRILAWGSVFRGYVKSNLTGAAKRDVISYLELNDLLWENVFQTKPDRLDKYTPDLWTALRYAASLGPSPETEAMHLVIPQAQRLPSDFYWLLRILGIAVTALVDAAESETGESTLNEIRAALGCEPLRIDRPSTSTVAIHDLIESLTSATRIAPAPSRRQGTVPVLRSHPSREDECLAIEHLVKSSPKGSVGLLLPTSEAVREYRDGVASTEVGQVHSYLSSDSFHVPIDWRSPGLTVLTWSSAMGSRFDTVVLAGLELLDDDPPYPLLRNAIATLGVTARRELILSFTGRGRPAALSCLSTDFVDDRTDFPATMQSSATVQAITPDDSLPILEVPGSESQTSQVAPRDIEAAIGILEFDLHHSHPAKRRRILTASEEIGLSHLMREGQLDLHEELPHQFRSGLADDDRRARAFDAFVTHNIGLVWTVVTKHNARLLEPEDLFQEGVIGLMRAIEKFDATRGNKFSTYATAWIRQAVGRAIASRDALIRLPVHAFDAAQRLQRERVQLVNKGLDASPDAIGRATDMSAKEVSHLLWASQGLLSLDSPLPDSDEHTLGSLLVLPSAHPDTPKGWLRRHLRAEAVSDALEPLSAREKRILKLRFGLDDGQPRTLDQVGEQLGVTRERIRQIVNKALKRMRETSTSPDSAEVEHAAAQDSSDPNGTIPSAGKAPSIPSDPFLSHNLRSQDLGTEYLATEKDTVRVTPWVLPHPRTVPTSELETAGRISDWEGSQGFYIQCDGRWLGRPSWLGIPGLDRTAETALVRISVEIDPSALHDWGIEGADPEPTPPEALRTRLKSLAEIACDRSRQAVSTHGPIT
jgi:RNA polymerase primary sigma factor